LRGAYDWGVLADFGSDGLVTLMCGSVAARIDDDAFVAMIDQLKINPGSV
jgi:hypothetical protein